jgi:hypothetical protein
MEYRSLSRWEDALRTFEELRSRSPAYVPMYLMCAQVLESLGLPDDARTWLGQGAEAARAKGDEHALSEIEGALSRLPPASV